MCNCKRHCCKISYTEKKYCSKHHPKHPKVPCSHDHCKRLSKKSASHDSPSDLTSSRSAGLSLANPPSSASTGQAVSSALPSQTSKAPSFTSIPKTGDLAQQLESFEKPINKPSASPSRFDKSTQTPFTWTEKSKRSTKSPHKSPESPEKPPQTPPRCKKGNKRQHRGAHGSNHNGLKHFNSVPKSSTSRNKSKKTPASPSTRKQTVAPSFINPPTGSEQNYKNSTNLSRMSSSSKVGPEKLWFQSSNQDSLRHRFLAAINYERQALSLPKITLNAALNKYAAKHNYDQAFIMNEISHTGSDGSDLGDRIKRVGYEYAWCGENVAHRQETPEWCVQDLMNSPGHRENIVNEEAKEMGVHGGIGKDGYWYWTQVLGARRK